MGASYYLYYRKRHDYFTDRDVSNEHEGGGLFAYDEEIMGWLFSK